MKPRPLKWNLTLHVDCTVASCSLHDMTGTWSAFINNPCTLKCPFLLHTLLKNTYTVIILQAYKLTHRPRPFLQKGGGAVQFAMGLCTSRRSVVVPAITITRVKEAPPSPRPAQLADNAEGRLPQAGTHSPTRPGPWKEETPRLGDELSSFIRGEGESVDVRPTSLTHLGTFGDGPASRSLAAGLERAASLERTASLRESLCQPGANKPTATRPRHISSLLSAQSNPRLLLHRPPSPSPLSSSSTSCIRVPRWRAIKTSSHSAFSSTPQLSGRQLSGPGSDHLTASRREAENAGAFCKVMTIIPTVCPFCAY